MEVRIYPTYKIAADLHMLPELLRRPHPSPDRLRHATLFFRQFFMTIPNKLIEASKLDGAGPVRFFKDTVLPTISAPTSPRYLVILFIYGWNRICGRC